MGPGLFLIAILGCGEGDSPCQEVRVAEARYESQAACTAATATALERHADLAFPNVVAQCRLAGAPATLLRGSEVMRPAPPRFAGIARIRSSR